MPKKKAAAAQKKPWWHTSWDKLLFLLVLLVFFLFYPGQSIYMMIPSGRPAAVRPLPFPLPAPAPYPINKTNVYPGEEITATGVVILDAAAGVYLYKRNADLPFSPASTTKIMTALIAIGTYDLDEIVTVQSVLNDGQVMGLVPGERISVENLLYGTLVQSGNDAAYALAQHYPGGVEKFVEAMNTKAREFHLVHTTFTNPVGFDDVSHKMTPADLAMLARIALSDPTLTKMVAIPQITVSDVTHTYFHPLKNVNQLLGKIPGVGGIKTGWTEEAGENLVTLMERNNRRIILVILHSEDRFGETTKLIDWVFANHTWEEVKPPYPR